ncbi:MULTISPECIES: hypothetical protein [Acidithiobacillus]|uniref:hypothetical protein n=1 Tax=Acidithiobacillus TaxID=119977 RepID=UPI0012DAA714|nr:MULTISPECIES: hypothetical protein [Acidithiobacillus]MEB8488170.1 hypothetical protein [Acidithiobacillus ferriphilus]MEB8488756.1 hypothetical protein [Acidithiobacillus ferriphilus]MEB8492200.1 hypothetical protein [Acidithiobacillus ferriphilus]MEB8520683.1 hypothetical protein [Acidithiobacillus ferriphilus]MEB8533274.1 hypothetical protein [Acidithiobacillus ferriphilus]
MDLPAAVCNAISCDPFRMVPTIKVAARHRPSSAIAIDNHVHNLKPCGPINNGPATQVNGFLRIVDERFLPRPIGADFFERHCGKLILSDVHTISWI